MNNDLIRKIVTFEDMSQSQIDRMNLNNSSYATVIKFLDLVVEKIQNGEDLEVDLKTNLKKMITPIDPENVDDVEREMLSPNQQINLYLGLLKYKSELSAPIINVLKEAVKVNVVNNSGGQGNGNLFPTIPQGDTFSKEDIQKSKKLLSIADKIESSEFSLEELEQLIEEKKKNR